MLLAALQTWGFEAVDLGHAPDDRAAIRARLDTPSVDAILTSGGASSGDADLISALLKETQSLAVWRIAVKPGRPLALGVWNGRPVFGLPGNPVAAMVCACMFARPALGLLAGEGWTEPKGFTCPARFSKHKKAGRREYLRARLVDGGVEAFGSEGSGRISGLSWADGLVELPDEALVVQEGDPVRFIPWSGFGT
jgi:molybdopterin molybdotransferase